MRALSVGLSLPRSRSTSAAATVRPFELSRRTRIFPCRSQRRSVSRLMPSARAASPAVYEVRAIHASLLPRYCIGKSPKVGPLAYGRRGAPRDGAEITPVEPDLVRTSEGAKRLADTPQWGIEPVPERLRVLGLFDTTLLWTNLGISLLVLVLRRTSTCRCATRSPPRSSAASSATACSRWPR